MSFFKKLKDRMFRSSDKIGEGLEALVTEVGDTPTAVAEPEKPGLLGRLIGRADEPRRVLDDAMLESLEELLIQADMGVDTATRVTANIAEGRFGKRISTADLRAALASADIGARREQQRLLEQRLGQDIHWHLLDYMIQARLTVEQISQGMREKTLTPAQLAGYDRAGALAKSGRTLSAGEIGCYLSHVDCARRFLASGADHALVLEDDFHADADLPAFLQALAAHLGPRADWDVVNLGNAAKRFATTSARVIYRSTLIPLLSELTRTRTTADWIALLEDKAVPCGPINNIAQAFDDPQAKARGLRVELARSPDGMPVDGISRLATVASPLRLSEHPPVLRHAPPALGQHTTEVLQQLGLSPEQMAELRAQGVV